MKRLFRNLIPALLISTVGYAQPEQIEETWAVKYDNGGYDWTSDMQVGANGNVYITGYSYTNNNSQYEIATVSYDANGTELWSQLYDGGRYTYARALSAGVDGSVAINGQVYPDGSNYYQMVTVKYDVNGNLLWARNYSPSANTYTYGTDVVTLDDGSVIATGHSYYSGSYTVHFVKYDVAGNIVWTSQQSFQNYNSNNGLGVDAAGNIYLVGQVYNYNSGNYYDIVITKIDANGTLLYTKTYDSGSYDYARDVAVSPSGNVYVTAYHRSYASNNYYHYLTMKFDTNGDLQWDNVYTGGLYSYPMGIDINADEEVAVSGYSYDQTNHYRYLTVKYDTDGNLLWDNNIDVSFSHDVAYDVAMNEAGDVFVTGYTYNTNGYYYGYDALTAKIGGSNGETVWTSVYSGDEANNDCNYYYYYDYTYGYKIDTDPAGDAYVAMYDYNYNYCNNNNNRGDMVTVKYDGASVEPLVIENVSLSDYNGFNVACFGGDNGEATLTVVGGLEPYVYSVNGNVVSNPVENLTAGNHTITVSDASGQEASVEVSLTQPFGIETSITENQTVYFGYDAENGCTDVTIAALGGVPGYTFNWSNGDEGNAINVCPETSTDYTVTVTDQNRCTVTAVTTVCVVDVRCEKGGKSIIPGQGDKVMVCHLPGGNPNKAKTLCIGYEAVADHLAHGDLLGACDAERTCDGNRAYSTATATYEITMADLMNIEIYPNPASDITYLEVTSMEDFDGQIELVNMMGQSVSTVFNGKIYEMDQKQIAIDLTSLSQGVYFVQFTSSNGEKVVKRLIVNK